jgi:hypothetical protein
LPRKSSGVGLSLIVDLQLSVIWVNAARIAPLLSMDSPSLVNRPPIGHNA